MRMGASVSSIDQNDIQYLRDIQHDERVALREKQDALLCWGRRNYKAFKLYRVGAGSDCI